MTKHRASHSLFLGLFVILLAMPVFHVLAQKADLEGPLGLTWGFSADQVRALGVDLKDGPPSDFGVSYAATKLPRAVSDQELAFVSFGYDDKLWRVMAISRPFSSDPSGTNIKSRYQELSTILAEKYGKPLSVQSLGDSIYKQPQYFLAGINGGHSSWYSNYETPKLFVQLSLAAESSSTGRWRIIFEEKSLRQAFDLARKAKEKGAL